MTTFMNPFKKAHELIKKHPVKRLAWAATYDLDNDCRCATGMMAFESGVEGAFDERGSLTCLVEDRLAYVGHDVGEWAVAQGFMPVDLAIIEHINDRYSDYEMTEVARYAMVRRVLRALGEYDETQVDTLRTAYAARARDLRGQSELVNAILKEVGA